MNVNTVKAIDIIDKLSTKQYSYFCKPYDGNPTASVKRQTGTISLIKNHLDNKIRIGLNKADYLIWTSIRIDLMKYTDEEDIVKMYEQRKVIKEMPSVYYKKLHLYFKEIRSPILRNIERVHHGSHTLWYSIDGEGFYKTNKVLGKELLNLYENFSQLSIEKLFTTS